MESFLRELRGVAEEWGCAAQRVQRTFSPTWFLSQVEEGKPWLVVYLQECDWDEEEVKAGLVWKMGLRVTILQKVSSPANETLDPVLELMEKLRNWLVTFKQWKSEQRHYTITKMEAAEVVSDAALDDLVALCAIDLDLETLVPYGG